MKVGGGGLILFNLCLKKYFYEKLMQISYRYSSFGLNCSIAVLKEKNPTYFLKYLAILQRTCFAQKAKLYRYDVVY